MSVYVIADLHLCTDNESKSMEVFGNRWKDYKNRIQTNWNKLVAPEDTVIIPGDISWALTLQDAISDLKFIDSLNGKKIIMKGNHDFWWSSVTKMNALFSELSISSISVLNNNALEVEDYIITGSRGWFIDPSVQTKNVNADFEKVNNRELIRLKIGLEAAQKMKEETGTIEYKNVSFGYPSATSNVLNDISFKPKKSNNPSSSKSISNSSAPKPITIITS